MVVLFMTSCEKDFDELNTNPIRLTSVDPTFQLNQAIISSAPGYGNLTYETTIVRQMITPFQGVGTGANLNQDNRSATEAIWNTGYRTIVKNLVDGLAGVDPERTNLKSILEIWSAHAFMVLTDTYGDVPFSESGLAYLEGVSFPVYDSQESIYSALISRLMSATAALSESTGGSIGQDILYGGDVQQWKRLGNSLLLRAGMRLSKVNPSLAMSTVSAAVSGGLMQSNDDNAVVRHTADFRNGVGTNLNGGQSPFYYLDREFVNFMKENNDPRLAAIGVRYVGALSGGDQVESRADRTFEAQVGMPQGFLNTQLQPIAEEDGLASFYDYSQLDRTRLGNPEAPSFLVTYSQTQLLLAEAIVRGWASGDAQEEYAKGIRANLEQFSEWPGVSDFSAEEIDAYVAGVTLESGKEIEQINTQYWVSAFLNGPETWANFRRSGFPVVAPNPFPGNDLENEDFIRRLTYPDGEKTVNGPNLSTAIARQGPDVLSTRVWWDVK